MFLVWKATKEIDHHVDPNAGPDVFDRKDAVAVSFAAIIGQIMLLDVVFSVDSIITAVGMTPHLPVMVIAVVVAVAVMLFAANPLAGFINANPTVVMLALGFLIHDRHHADRRRLRCSGAQGLHLRGDGVCGAGRGPEHDVAPRATAAVALAEKVRV